jgi:hypothetical protein
MVPGSIIGGLDVLIININLFDLHKWAVWGHSWRPVYDHHQYHIVQSSRLGLSGEGGVNTEARSTH